MKTITLKEVLAEIDQNKEFEIGFYTADRNRDKGGEFILVKRAFKSRWKTTEQHIESEAAGTSRRRCDPRHFQNSTRNIVRATNQDVITVHIRLIRRFNGKTVL